MTKISIKNLPAKVIVFGAIMITAVTITGSMVGCDRQQTGATDPADSPSPNSAGGTNDDASVVNNFPGDNDPGDGQAIDSMADVTRDASGKLVAIDLRGREINDSLILALADQRDVKSLKLNGDKIDKATDDLVILVTLMPNLKVLAVDGISLPSNFFAMFAKPANLVELYASNATVNDQTGVAIGGMTNLKKLRLAKNAIALNTCQKIGSLSELVDLDISGCPLIGDDEVAELASLAQLSKLNLYDTAVGDAAAESLSNFSSLTWLNLDKTKITDAAVDSISALPSLEFLHLGSTAITDAAAESLSKMTSLRTLIVTRTEMTQSGVDKIAAALPDTDIQLTSEPQ